MPGQITDQGEAIRDREERRWQARWDRQLQTLPANADKDEPAEESLPVAKHRGFLNILELDVPCYVLDNGLRVIGRTTFTETITGIKGGGGLEKYLGVNNLKPFIPMDLVLERFVTFRLLEVEGLQKQVKGLTADLVIDVCRWFLAALGGGGQAQIRKQADPCQREMAIKCSMFLRAVRRLAWMR